MLVFVIENTASMAAHINRLLSSYIEPLVQSIDGPLGLVQFSKQQAIIKLSTPKKPLIIETIKKMKMENGCCSYNALTEGLEKAVQLLNNIQGPKHIVIVSSTNGIGFQSVALSIQEKSINLSAILPLRGLKEIEEVCKNTSINDVLCQTDFISLNGLNINAIQKRKAEKSENKIFKMTEEPGALVETSGEATNKTENTKQSPPISSVSVSGSTVTRRRQPVRKKSSGPKPKLEKKASVEVIKEEPTTKDTPIDLTSPIKTEPQPFGIQNAGIQLLQSQQQQLDAYNMLLKSQNSTPQSNVNTPQLGLNSNINGSQNQTMNNFTPQQQLALQQQLNRNANDPNYGQSILQKEQMAHQQLIAQNNASAGPATLGQQNLAQNAAVQQLLAQRMQMNNQFNLNQTGQRPPVNGVGNNFSGNVTSWSGQIAWSVMNPTLSQAQKLTISVRGTPIRNPNVDD
ncbi:hypothetical protein HDV02_001076 [Globomyces sp. JEL0801]|nr:hypothetical protein HDV02_001076 [Globomyces sp. JEL0801]